MLSANSCRPKYREVAHRISLSPSERWVEPRRPRTVPDWLPFAGNLSARSTAYAFSVLEALFRWLIEQRYVLANPFAGNKVHGKTRVGLGRHRPSQADA
jgi:hypothetical protein